MTDFNRLQRDLSNVNQKVDKLSQAITSICIDLGTRYAGTKTNTKITKIESDISKMIQENNIYGGKRLSDRIDSLENNIDYFKKGLDDLEYQIDGLIRSLDINQQNQKNVHKALIDIYQNTKHLQTIIVEEEMNDLL